MKQNVLSKDKYTPSCAYCLHGKLSADEESVLCVKKGVMLPDSSCKKYAYDPLKRRPKKMIPMDEHDAEEFKL